VGEEAWGLLSFVAFVCVWVYFYCCSRGCCVRDCKWLGLCTVGTVGQSVGGECVGEVVC
jgi:hypothetical protein